MQIHRKPATCWTPRLSTRPSGRRLCRIAILRSEVAHARPSSKHTAPGGHSPTLPATARHASSCPTPPPPCPATRPPVRLATPLVPMLLFLTVLWPSRALTSGAEIVGGRRVPEHKPHAHHSDGSPSLTPPFLARASHASAEATVQTNVVASALPHSPTRACLETRAKSLIIHRCLELCRWQPRRDGRYQ